LRRLRDGLSRAAGWVRDRARASARSIKSLLTRAVGWVRDKTSSAARRVKSLFLATIGEDRGFGFWWLVVTAAVALAIGLLVAVLLSPIIGILAALIVGIWMLVRRSRSSHSRQASKAGLAN
jgi:apolipoprotein N-acyltransferase